MKKITKRTVYETLIKVANGEDFTQYITAEDLRAFAENEIGLLDKRVAVGPDDLVELSFDSLKEALAVLVRICFVFFSHSSDLSKCDYFVSL